MKRVVKIAAPFIGFLAFYGILLFGIVLSSDEEESSSISSEIGSLTVSPEVLKHQSLVEKYCKEYGIPDHVKTILAIMQVESGGKVADVMQSTESLGLPPNSLSTEESIKQGCKYFSKLISGIKANDCDINTAIQSYNFGGGFINYIAKNGKKYSYELAESFSKEKSGGKKINYQNPIAIPVNGGWRYGYGNQFYIDIAEFNEAFAAQSVAVIKDLDIDESIVNVNGGAIALGHPLGASGCRILVSLIHEMIRREDKVGLAALCVGGGMGCSTIIRKK